MMNSDEETSIIVLVMDYFYRKIRSASRVPRQVSNFSGHNRLMDLLYGNDRRFDCVGTIDGTHIPCIVDAHLQATYRNRKGYMSQNILAVVDFDMKFTYLVAGWEGSVHDSRVLRDAMSDPTFLFPTPPGGGGEEDNHDEDDMEQGGDTIGKDAAPSTQQDEGHQTEMGQFQDALIESMWAY
ncbi:hypothetical protein UlMin_038850 [Ulmus minor]